MTNKPKFLLVYGSQTGQAEAIAEEIRDYAAAHGLEADFHCMDKTEKKVGGSQSRPTWGIASLR
jgi:flavodoxin